jgi:hypothetical protein
MSDYPSDPALFAQLTPDENRILSTHLNSGWYKQAAVYPALSEPWLETEALLKDLSEAHHAAMQARLAAPKEPQARIAEPEQQEPEAGQ